MAGEFFCISWQRSVHFDNRTSDLLIDGRVMGQVLSDPALWLLLEYFGLLFVTQNCGCSVIEKDTSPKAMLMASLAECPHWP